MNEIEKLFDQSHAPSDVEAREIVTHFFKDIRLSLLNDGADPVHYAYKIAGLMGTNFAHRLSKDDPINEILVIAGELETNPLNAGALTQELMTKIGDL